jgi:hypothetical protein
MWASAPAALGRAGQRAVVEALHEPDRRRRQQRAEEADHEALVEVHDVGIAPDDEVAVGGGHALPERLALAGAVAALGQAAVGVLDARAGLAGPAGGLVGGAVVHHEDLVEQGDGLHEGAPRQGHVGPDRCGLVLRRDAQRDALCSLGFGQGLRREVAVVEQAGDPPHGRQSNRQIVVVATPVG